MKAKYLDIVVPGAVGGLGITLIAVWLGSGTLDGLALRIPGMDREGYRGKMIEEAPPEAGLPIAGEGVPSDLAGEWPSFRGPLGNGIAPSGVPLAREWPEGGPEVVWSIGLGPGHGGAAVSGGRVWLLDYDVAAQADTMRCLSLDDGRTIWRNGYPVVLKEWHGMSRAVPAVSDGFVVSIGPKCHVACWEVETGTCRWLLDLVGKYGATVPQWYTGQCPLIDQGRVIVAPAGDAFMVALDLASGEVIWESPKLSLGEMTHVSILPMEFQGERIYVYCSGRGVAGVSAHDGSIVWETNQWVGKMATCPTPVLVGDGKIFFSGGYNAGSLMMRLKEVGGQVVAESLFRLKARRFESEQQTPIYFEGHLFGSRTNPGGNQLVCLDMEGNERWNSGTDKFERGPYLIADGLLYVMDSNGLLTLVEASPEAYTRLAQFQVFENGHDAWGPMALAGGRLLLRDLTRMACLDVSAK